MSGAIKKTTNLTRMKVATNPHYTLGILYGKLSRVLQKMPEDAAYRKYTEEIIKGRSKIVNETKNIQEIEEKINCGQIEEIIIQAENELLLARKMLNWQPWEGLTNPPPKGQWTWPPV